MQNKFIKRFIGLVIISALALFITSIPSSSTMDSGYFTTSATYEIQDGELLLQFALTNHHSAPQQLKFGSGQQYEIIISDENGTEVYRYSDNKMFTMALIYKDLQPGDTLHWQEKWDLTNKDGVKLTSGKYNIVIKVMTSAEDDQSAIPEEQLTTTMEINLASAIAKSVISNTADQVINALRDKNAEKLAQFVHPVKGVRFTPYTYVQVDQDIVMDQAAIKNFFYDENQYLWGYYDGTGCEIILTPTEYYQKFIYSHDFANAEQVGYNEVLSFGNMLENQFEIYDNPIIVEYYFSGFNPDYVGMDWRSLRLVFEQYEDDWYLVGIISNQWTI